MLSVKLRLIVIWILYISNQEESAMAFKLSVIIRIFIPKSALIIFFSIFLICCSNEKQDSGAMKSGHKITPVETNSYAIEFNQQKQLGVHDQANIVIKSDASDLQENVKPIEPLLNNKAVENIIRIDKTEIRISKDYIEIKIAKKDLEKQQNVEEKRKVNVSKKEKPLKDLDSSFIHNY